MVLVLDVEKSYWKSLTIYMFWW